jgi:hypothetical protein
MSYSYESIPASIEVPFTIPSQYQRDPVIEALEARFQQLTDLEVWEHCMGMNCISNIPAFAREAANHIVVVCLDCEHWSNNTDEMTEVGIVTFSRRDVASLVAQGDFGDHGEHLMQQVQFNLLRLIENTHLPNLNPDSRGVLGNRFGKWRFVTFAQARQILHDVFVQPIKNVPGLRGNHPIVVLGHDVGHDRSNLKQKAIEFDIEPLGTVVRYVDTQVLVRDKRYWELQKEQIGLVNLVANLWFQHSDPHTAANDAARTLMSAFQIGLGEHACKKDTKKSMLEVANSLEQYSVANFKSIGGVEEYCWRCGQPGHMKPACTATDLHCDACEIKRCRHKFEEEHVSAHCICVANERAAARRAKDLLARTLKKKKNKYTPRGRSFSQDHGRPLSRNKTPRPSLSPSRTPNPRQANRHETTPKGVRGGKFLNGGWRGPSNNRYGYRFGNGRGSGGQSSRDGTDKC